MSSAREQLDALNKQITDLTARRDALEASADFIDSMEGKVDLPVPQFADLIAAYEAFKKQSVAVADGAAEEITVEPSLDVVAEPTASAKA